MLDATFVKDFAAVCMFGIVALAIGKAVIDMVKIFRKNGKNKEENK